MAPLTRFPALALALAVVITAFTISSAVKYRVINDAFNTPGGQRFIDIGGPKLVMDTLERSGQFIFNILKLPSNGNHGEVNLITCIIDKKSTPTHVQGSQIIINATDLESIPGDTTQVRVELIGMLFHMQTRIWQSTGKNQALPGLLTGVADYVRYAAGYEPRDGHWVKPGQGTRWDEGFDVTARFLADLEGVKPGFVAELNHLMVYEYSDNFFVDQFQRPPAELFSIYKAKYAS